MIYLASPYSHKNKLVQDLRFIEVCLVAGRLINMGKHVFSPIAHCHPLAVLQDLGTDHEYWLEQNHFMIRSCQKVWVVTMAGWSRSRGVQDEIAYAKKMGFSVYFVNPLTLDVSYDMPLDCEEEMPYYQAMSNIQIPTNGSIAIINLAGLAADGHTQVGLGSLTATLDDGVHAYIAASGVGQFQIFPKLYTPGGNTVTVTLTATSVDGTPIAPENLPVIKADIAGTGEGPQATSVIVSGVNVSPTAAQPDPGTLTITIPVS